MSKSVAQSVSSHNYLFPPDIYANFIPANDIVADPSLLPAPSKVKKNKISLHKSSEPKTAEEIYEIGQQYIEKKHFDRAIMQFNRLLEINPGNLEALKNLAFCLVATGRMELALKSYQLASILAPGDTAILRGIAHCHEVQGNFAQAVTIYEGILAKEPSNIKCLFSLVNIGEYTSDTPIVRQLINLHQTAGIPDNTRIMICFSLAKIYESEGNTRRAFDYYKEGNDLKFANLSYDEAELFGYLDALENTFNPQLFSELGGWGISDDTPIFVLGMPRSGTTLVEQILASHPHVYGAGEMSTMTDIVTRLIPQLTGKDALQGIRDLNQWTFESLAEYYLKVLRSYCSKETRHVVDKMPCNFFNIGFIHLLFPRARIIHCVREPMDTCWSMYRQFFNGAHPYCYDQASLGRFYLRYEKLMRHWHKVIPGKLYDVQYEELVKNPKQVVAGLLKHCDLPWDEKCMEFHKTKRSVSTASLRQVRNPIYTSSIGLWLPIATELTDLLQALGGPIV